MKFVQIRKYSWMRSWPIARCENVRGSPVEIYTCSYVADLKLDSIICVGRLQMVASWGFRSVYKVRKILLGIIISATNKCYKYGEADSRAVVTFQLTAPTSLMHILSKLHSATYHIYMQHIQPWIHRPIRSRNWNYHVPNAVSTQPKFSGRKERHTFLL